MSGERVSFTVPCGAEGSRLDRFLADQMRGQTRSALRRLILDGRVTIDGRAAAKPGLGLKPGMRVELDVPEAPPAGVLAEKIPIEIVHEDELLVVVNKPAGLVVHPGHGRRTGTLVGALLGLGVPLAAAGGAVRPGIVHRLDADTSGLLVVAKTDEAHRMLARAFAQRQVRKTYRALVWGHPSPVEGRIDRNIGRSRSNPTRMSVDAARGRSAATVYRSVETLPGFSLLQLGLETGRTHQIRVHLQSIHHPVVGDTRYGGVQWKGVQDPVKRKALREFRRLALHASDLGFQHPRGGQEVVFHAPLPEDIERLLRVLRGST